MNEKKTNQRIHDFEEIEDDDVRRFGNEDSLNLQQFMPTTRILSERESLEKEELSKNTFKGEDTNVEIILSNERVPKYLSSFAFDKGVPTMFDQPEKSDSGYLGNHLIYLYICIENNR